MTIDNKKGYRIRAEMVAVLMKKWPLVGFFVVHPNVHVHLHCQGCRPYRKLNTDPIQNHKPVKTLQSVTWVCKVNSKLHKQHNSYVVNWGSLLKDWYVKLRIFWISTGASNFIWLFIFDINFRSNMVLDVEVSWSHPVLTRKMKKNQSLTDLSIRYPEK